MRVAFLMLLILLSCESFTVYTTKESQTEQSTLNEKEIYRASQIMKFN